MWERAVLPASGGLDTQDAWLLAALDYVQGVKNSIELRARSDHGDAD